MSDSAQVFNQAANLHRAGDLAAAEQLYLRVLANEPKHFDAQHMLGVLRCQQRRFDEALSLIGGALRQNPGFPPVHLNHGLALGALKRPQEALASFEKALALAPDYAEAHYQRGVALRSLDRAPEALESFDKALAARPAYAEALNNRGNVLQELGRPLEALASYDQALALQPRNPSALNSRGNTLRDLGRYEEAVASYDKALAITPDHVEALNNRGLALLGLDRPAEALASFDQALARKPDYAKALNNRGGVLQALRRGTEALACYDALLAFAPDHAAAHYNRGIVLRDLRRLPEALASFEAALAVTPDDADALNNRGLVLRDLKRPDEARASLDQALAIAPDNAEIHANRATLCLLLGDFTHGFQELEWRWQVPEVAPWRRSFSRALWLGAESLAGRTILLHAEQGFGDAIQFVRYVPLIAAGGARVLLEVPQPLRDLFASVAGASAVVARGDPLPDFDCHCPLASVPLALNTIMTTIPATVPYLSVPQEQVAKWRPALPSTSRRRVGFAWAGNPMFKGDQTRSVGLAPFLPLLTTAGIDFVSLQKDLRDGDRELLATCPGVTHLGDAIADFADTAAIMASLDLVISTDTSVAHLAGALGKPVWILLQHVADWRWLLDRTDSPWYPTARLFRQPEDGDWDSVVRRMRDELQAFEI
jgi:tetratricopeptide (TPR) repeat protein